ncbi:MAG: C69 family dipeptidase, partial [Bacteroidales bacterium]|nr:C69 family dipeptidase [Bacteroidales bacterium]
MKKLLFAAALFSIFNFQFSISQACTNFLFTKGATKDGSTMITYAADSHVLYGELYYRRAATYPAGTMFQVVDWDSGKPLIQIPQVAETYSVVGNINEYQLAIGETTYGGREELANEIEGGIDYGSLIYLTLQRAKNAREAIQVLAGFLTQYP